jgi:hypothetical protein
VELADLTVAGYRTCADPACGALVLDVVAAKTRGHCAECFRRRANEILDAAVVVVAGRERLVLRTAPRVRSPGEAAQRKRSKRASVTQRKRQREVTAARARADRRLRNIFVELWETILADERARAGLDPPWTIERALTPGDAEKSLDFLKRYRRV